MSGAKPFPISQPEGWKAYRHVKSNGGAAGVDAESIEAFEQDRKRTLYRLGNRLASGTYCPPAGAGGRDFQAGWGRAEAGDSDGHGKLRHRPVRLQSA